LLHETQQPHRITCYCVVDNCLREDAKASAEIKRTSKKQEKQTGSEKFGMGRAFRNSHLAQWIASEADHRRVLDWITNDRLFITVLGHPGTGKSYLSAAILNFLYEAGREVAYVTHRKFIEEIHFAMQDGKTQHSVMPRYSEKEFLIIDDLGSATCTEWQQEMLLELIDRRYANKAKTVITSNFNKQELYKKLGDRTASRLLDKHNILIEIWTKDRRLDQEFDVGDFWKTREMGRE
jgi:DNA replication protein DnaC